jgi:hypothetical protein
MSDQDRARVENVSVVYFHGMGSQRRFEETSRLVDRLDSYTESAFKRGLRLGQLGEIHARAETGVDEDAPDVSYIRAIHLHEFRNWEGPRTNARFYEAYWADEMREERSVRAVIKWILRQVWRPVTMLWTPWRERQRIRRATLIELLETPEAWPEDTLEGDFRTLLGLYEDFDHPNWFRRVWALEKEGETVKDDFAGFLRMIEDRNRDKPGRIARLKTLAQTWRRRHVRREIANFVLMLSLLLAILLIVLLVTAGVFTLLARFPVVLELLGLAEDAQIPHWARPTWGNALAIGFGVLLAVGLRGFLVHRLADVEAWSTYAETDEKFAKREAVLKKSVDLLTHVCQREDCDRVVVVAHSLGTSVAYDTLLAAVHANRAVRPDNQMIGRVDFRKISHFVTLASPIDKISYFFESFRSPVRRYRKIYDELRGDIGTAPFTKSGGQPQIHWVNIWDRADIISGPLHSPAAARWIDARIDNMHVNTLAYFNPGAAHNAYFDHYGVIGALFDIILRDRGRYDSQILPPRFLPSGRRKGLDYRAVDLGPGAGRNTWARVRLCLVAAPWAWLFYLIAWMLAPGMVAYGLLTVAVALTAVPVMAMLGRIRLKNVVADPLD